MSRIPHQLTMAVIIANRGFFPGYVVNEAREQIIEVFIQHDINPVMLDETQTRYGGVETRAEAKICAAWLRARRDDIHGVVVLLPNFGDEKAVSEALRLSGLNVPVLIQAQPDRLDKMHLASRRDSFCGKISLCNNLRQYDIPFTLTTQHVSDLAGESFARDISRFKEVCRVVSSMRGARVGAIGARPAGFNTVRYSEKLLERLGIAVETLDLSEVFSRMKRLGDSDIRVDEKRRLLLDNAHVSTMASDKITLMAKLFVVIAEWVIAEDIDATAIQCWTSLQETLGINACSVMSVMSGQLLPSACEVDVMGALSMYALASCSLSPASIADWNNNYGDDPDKCVLFHCGNFATASLEDATMGTANIIGHRVGNENTCGAVHGRSKTGNITFFRLSSDDLRGEIKAYVGEGVAVNDPLDTVGCRAVIEVPQLERLLAWICRNGFEHHVAFNHASCAEALHEAFTRYLQVGTHFHCQ